MRRRSVEMIVDCDRCAVRGDACTDCVITVLLGEPPGRVLLDDTEQRAIDVLASVGMVPRLRLVPTSPPPAPEGTHCTHGTAHGTARNAARDVAGWAEERAERSTREAG